MMKGRQKKETSKNKYGSGKRSWLVKRNTGAGIKLPRVPSGDRGLLMSLLSVSTEHPSATYVTTKYRLRTITIVLTFVIDILHFLHFLQKVCCEMHIVQLNSVVGFI